MSEENLDLSNVDWADLEEAPEVTLADADAAEEAVAEKPAKKKKAKKAKKAKAEPELDENGEPVKKSRKRRYTDDQAREMYRLYKEGVAKKQIAVQFECSAVFVYNMVKRNVYQDLDFSDMDAEFEKIAQDAADAAPEAEEATE